jgi:Amt family ammonium transporter
MAFGLLVVGASCLTWLLLKVTIGLRVGADEEDEGLDIGEHGLEAYPGFTRAAPEPEALEIS